MSENPLRATLDTTSLILELAIEGSATGIWDRNVVTGEITYSSGWKALFGYAEPQVGNRIEESYTRVHPEDLPYVQRAMQEHFDGKTERYQVEHRLRCADGSYKWARSRGQVVARDAEGRALRMVGTTTDITGLRELNDRLQQNIDLVTLLTNEVPGLVFQFCRGADRLEHFSYVSEGVTEMFEVTPGAALTDPQSIHQRIHPDDVLRYYAALEASAQTLEPLHCEICVQLPRAGLRWRQVNARPRRLPSGAVLWHGLIIDITDRKNFELNLQQLATIDFLTQLPNRRYFMSRLDTELARVQREAGTRAAILMFDLDHFKNINDTYGHGAGDSVLKSFAAILQDGLRKMDTVGRVGGEEFAVILASAGVAEAQLFAARVRKKLEASALRIGPLSITISVSIGITELGAADTSIESSLARSDLALYRAKEGGRDRVEVEMHDVAGMQVKSRH